LFFPDTADLKAGVTIWEIIPAGGLEVKKELVKCDRRKGLAVSRQITYCGITVFWIYYNGFGNISGFLQENRKGNIDGTNGQANHR
jgi:hypothetical protein